MADRSSRPHHSPARTPGHLVRRIVRLRWRHRMSPVQIAGRLDLPASTVHAVLARCRINRLSRIDRVTGEPLRRYEHDHPGSLIHVDVTKLGNIPDGGGHRYVGRQQGEINKRSTPGLPRGADYKPRTGTAMLHTVIDDHFRVAYAKSTPTKPPLRCCAGPPPGSPTSASPSNESCPTTARPTAPTPGLTLAPSWASSRNGPGPTGPEQRQNRTLPPHVAGGWAYAGFHSSETDRRAALPGWLRFYNHHRPHSSVGGKPPSTRLTNLPDITVRACLTKPWSK